MKKNALLLILLGLLFFSPDARSQKNEWVEQVFIGVGGKFETSPPYTDYVTMQSYDPATKLSDYFNTIYTQSVQDILIDEGFAYVAAQDSIIKYDITTLQRVAAISDSGISRLAIFSDKLLVSKQYPIKRFFVEVLNAGSLALLDRIQYISGDCGDIYCTKDSVYVAVNGGYTSTEGKLAVINPSTWDVTREINFGTDAAGTFDLYFYDGCIFSINRSGYGSSTGSITAYNVYTMTFTTYPISFVIADGLGIIDSVLYLKVNEGVGSFNLKTRQMINHLFIPDPGSANHVYITSGAVDYVNDYLYVNISNRLTWGINVIFNTDGDSLDTFVTGINPDAIALDYRVPVSIDPPSAIEPSIAVYPNPVMAKARIQYFGEGAALEYAIVDLTGKTVEKGSWTGTDNVAWIDCSGYRSGIYFLRVTSDKGTITRKFIKQ